MNSVYSNQKKLCSFLIQYRSKLLYEAFLQFSSAYRDREWNDRSYPITERIHREELSLPVSPVMAEAEADAVIDAINRFSPKDE